MKDAAKQRKTKLYDHLKRAIMTLELRPGADLDETQLCDAFELSRTPLREVLRQLSGEGYIELRENRGAWVSEMSYTTLRDFFLAAPMIYGAILRLAATNATPAQVIALKEVQEEFKTSLTNADAAARALNNNRFHEITGEMANNVYLLPSFRRLLIDHARIGMTFYRPNNTDMKENLSEASNQHDAIIEAIEAGDENAAAQLAIDHWNLSRDQIEMFVTPSSLEIPLGSVSMKT
ncbi:GntR family transcriptional regulator [Curvivirga aplysinae]|uniref:GntR family transcriptional regulator n=1 Tax=Curvivirga aplysinae TaxID=2529852 RepID=UPI001C3F4FA7|nr:GntR family transcriptional regulator [Curvivirga aplysinae]MTI09735.1 GntR family transcriptional regulator [Curvivirga aplysinae]